MQLTDLKRKKFCNLNSRINEANNHNGGNNHDCVCILFLVLINNSQTTCSTFKLKKTIIIWELKRMIKLYKYFVHFIYQWKPGPPTPPSNQIFRWQIWHPFVTELWWQKKFPLKILVSYFIKLATKLTPKILVSISFVTIFILLFRVKIHRH